MKKLLVMLFVGALVSLGCNQGNKGTVKATAHETSAGGTGHGATVSPTKSSSAAPATSGVAHEKETRGAGKSTKVGETKSK